MFTRRMLVTAVVTLVIAAGAGHIMQYGVSGESNQAMPAPRPTEWTPIQTRADASMLFSPTLRTAVPGPSVTESQLTFPEPVTVTGLSPALPKAKVSRISVPADSSYNPPGDDEINLNGFGMACEENIEATVAPGGMIELLLEAPCEPNAVVLLEHAGLRFRMRADTTGQLSVSIPAMQSKARISVTVGENVAVTETVPVPDAADFDRVAMLWEGSSALSLHALEFDAGPGGAGHVSARRSVLPASGDVAVGGFIQRLGDPELDDASLVEVYSFPSGYIEREGTVRLSVAARVTTENCGDTLAVSRIQTRGGAPVENTDIQIGFPDCEFAGRILVLKNLVEDLKIARK